ncbi:MAG: class II aldolase, partial [Gammaproteobacteria bacterium]|nr:class II aldolase [Gammaproteobacteria bacterium]
AVGGGRDIPLVPYALFGTKALSNHVVEGLTNRNACLLANHGAVIVGGHLQSTFSLAEEVENLAQQYCEVLKVGEPAILGDNEMDEVLEKFKSYGKRVE